MLNVKRLKELIKERERLFVETQDEWDYGIEKCWKELIKVLSEDIVSTIHYIDTECNDDEFSWFSEIFEEVARETQSQEFIDCLWRYANNHKKICDEYNIRDFIEGAQEEIQTNR